MSIICDYHVHSSFSGDSDSPMEEMIKSAIAKGLKQIAFTEHMDQGFPYKDGEEHIFELNTDSYLYDLIKFKEQYKEQIRIIYGVELGLQTSVVRENAIYIKNNEFDFVIGSLHLVDGMDVYYPEYFEGKSEEEAYGHYFDQILENIQRFDNYDVLGHLDYIVRYGANKDNNYRYLTYKDTIDRILSHVIDHEKGIELNTAGIRKGTKDVHPTLDILKRYKELGGEIITIGSDAHKPMDVSADFDRAEAALKEAGFKYYCLFENRIPEFKKL